MRGLTMLLVGSAGRSQLGTAYSARSGVRSQGGRLCEAQGRTVGGGVQNGVEENQEWVTAKSGCSYGER